MPLSSDPTIDVNLNNHHNLIKMSRNEFKRLPPPYDTGCREYPDGNGRRFQCLNGCYLRYYTSELKCVPISDSRLTIQLYAFNIEPNVTFCLNDSLIDNSKMSKVNHMIDSNCPHECPAPCVENVYSYRMFDMTYDDLLNIGNDIYYSYGFIPFSYRFALRDKFYVSINYAPTITIMTLVINVANILSLWHGINLISLIADLAKAVKNVLVKADSPNRFKRRIAAMVNKFAPLLARLNSKAYVCYYFTDY